MNRGLPFDPELWVHLAADSVLIPKRKGGACLDGSSSTDGFPQASRYAGAGEQERDSMSVGECCFSFGFYDWDLRVWDEEALGLESEDSSHLLGL